MSPHFRRIAPLLAGLLVVAASPAFAKKPAAATQPSGKDVLQRAHEAMGGDAAAKHQNRVQKGTFAMPAQGMSGSFTTYSAPPNNFLNVIEMAMIGEIKQGYDGKVAWSNDPMQGPRVLSEDELEGMLVEANFDSDLSTIFPSAENLGSASFADEDCWKLSLKMESGAETIGYFAKSTGYLVGMERKMKSPMGEMPVKILLSDYTEMEGMKVPKKTVMQMAGMEQVMTLLSVQANIADLPSFSPPPAVQALIKDKN